MQLSVVICTHNPKTKTFDLVLQALRAQKLPKENWELIVVDNCSVIPIAEIFDLSWHPNSKVIAESQPGLSHARLTGVRNARTELIVFVDDDNVLDKNYLTESYNLYQTHPEVGCFGGKSLPIYETTPPWWFKETGISLGCRDKGDEVYISQFASCNFEINSYPPLAPIGTGMVIQKRAFLAYLYEVQSNAKRMQLGRRKTSLTSGEDNDIILTIVKKGFEIAYYPTLVVHHLISADRYSPSYLERMAFESNRSWVKVLDIHHINPWKKIPKWTYHLRKIKNYFSLRPWQSPLASIAWKKSCGLNKGLSEI